MSPAIYPAAVLAVRAFDKEMRTTLPNEIVDCIQTHSGIAVAASFIPVGGLDVAALTGNIWTMYVRINRMLGISFSENMMKSLGSAVAANLASNLAVAGTGAIVKYIPFLGTITGGVMMGATMYGATICAAWVYLTAIARWVRNGSGSGDDLKSCVNDVMVQNKDKMNDISKGK